MEKYTSDNYKHSELTEKIIGEAYFVFNTLGFGFLEKVYENALYRRLINQGMKQNNNFQLMYILKVN